MKIVSLVLCLASSSVFAGATNHGKPIPPEAVLRKFDARSTRELAKYDEPAIARAKSGMILDKAKGEEQPIQVVYDQRCALVKKYAHAIGMLREAAIPTVLLPMSPQNLGFDTIPVKDVVFNNTSLDWSSAVELVKWNCDVLGFENLNTALEWYRTPYVTKK